LLETLTAHKQFFVVPETDELAREILIAREHLHEAKEGDKVVVKITKWGKHRENSEGQIAEVLEVR